MTATTDTTPNNKPHQRWKIMPSNNSNIRKISAATTAIITTVEITITITLTITAAARIKNNATLILILFKIKFKTTPSDTSRDEMAVSLQIDIASSRKSVWELLDGSWNVWISNGGDEEHEGGKGKGKVVEIWIET